LKKKKKEEKGKKTGKTENGDIAVAFMQ